MKQDGPRQARTRVATSSAVWLTFLVVTVTSARPQVPQAVLKPASPETEELIKQAIEDRFTAKNIPDQGLLGRSTRIAIREEMPGSGTILSRGALPKLAGYDFYLLSAARIQEEADKTGALQHFIMVTGPGIYGDSATMLLGVDVTFPRPLKARRTCCCTGLGQFKRAEGHWTFVRWLNIECY